MLLAIFSNTGTDLAVRKLSIRNNVTFRNSFYRLLELIHELKGYTYRWFTIYSETVNSVYQIKYPQFCYVY